MTITIRPAIPADRPRIDALLSAVYPRLLAGDYPAETLRAAHPLIASANPDLLASGTYHVVEDDDVIVAVGGWTRGAPTPDGIADDTGHVRHVATHPDHLHRGHAARLMARIREEARAARVDRLNCMSTVTALPFYARQGFQTLGPVEAQIGPGITFPLVQMELRP
ncbi:GNAT family N-acetyltransferase [Jannaschia sp. S6380]|uniref:GNAT family N-acetyltransferase n=1 Tax=Jannaschia sp. S6380 TaxID=2926408 RepID=UPI001FF6126C|nr:GNAT family N-acetyltransferase [Jannaschia sp. S6380]MCK0167500.1 GNAT family N-acetyltransferase [Jannaschia sp. S6380]